MRRLGLGAGISRRVGTRNGPALDLNFMSGALDSRVTFARASTATRFNASGVLETVASGAPRFDYNPVTLAPKGLLLEEARTNSVRNSAASGATVGVVGSGGALPTNWSLFSQNGLSTSVIGTGTQSGISYVDLRVFGTSTGAFYVLAFDSAAAALADTQSITASAYFALAGGSLANVTTTSVQARLNGAGGALSVTFTPDSTLTRRSVTATGISGTTGAFGAFGFTFASGAVIDVTLRIGLPQLEHGAFATSPIPTTTATVTRAADICHVPTSAFPFNAAAGTLFAEFTPLGISGLQTVVYLDDTTTNERMGIRSSAGTNAMLAVDDNATQVNASVGSVVAGTPYKVAMSYVLNDFAGCQNGGTVATDTVVTLPTVTRFLIGSRLSGSEVMSGHYRQARYWPTRRSNTDLQALTV